MKLEVGMYVRLINNNGMFGKIINVINLKHNFVEVQFQNIEMEIPTFFIKKASHNIIDLIEENDIILGKNGKIYQVWKIYKDYVFTYTKNKYGQTITLVDYQIDKILTKEQFENNCYRIGD